MTRTRTCKNGITRAENVKVVRILQAQGLTLAQSAEWLNVAYSTVRAWVNDPDGSKQRARRDRYRGLIQQADRPIGPIRKDTT